MVRHFVTKDNFQHHHALQYKTKCMWTNVLSESGTQYDLKKNLFKVYNMHLLGGMQYGYLYIEPNKHKCTDRHT